MQGNSCSGGNSDPAMLILNKDEEVATDITFATVVTPLITEQFVNVVGITGGLAGMIMDGASVDTTMFAAFPSCTDRMWATFPLAQGTHTITAPHPFTAYVYGQGPDYESYAYGLGTASANVSDTLICAMGGTVTLTAPAYITNGYWFNVDGPQDTLAFGNTYTFTPMGSTSIGVSQIGTGACTQGRRYHIGITTPVTIVVTADPGTVCAPGQVQLNVDVQPDTLNIVTVWDPPFLMDDALSTSPIATVLSDTWFHVHVTGDLGCSVSVDSVHVIAYPSPTATIMQAGNLLTSNAASDYQWFIGGAPIPGANSQNYVITLDGSYQVLITDANGCQAMSDTLTAIYQGISELGVAQMQLYADRSGAIIIHSDRNIEAVDVFDLLGQQVARSTEHANTVRVPVMSDGVYLVKVRIADNMLTRRLVVVR